MFKGVKKEFIYLEIKYMDYSEQYSLSLDFSVLGRYHWLMGF